MHPKRIILRILASLATVLALLAVAGFVTQFYLNDKIREIFIREINKQLAAEVQVDAVKLSLFRDFPYASVRFTNIRLKEAVNRNDKGYLMKAGVISMKFGLVDLFRNRFTITHLLVQDAKFNMRAYADGTDNFHFWKKSSGIRGNDFELDLHRIDIRHCRFTFLDDSLGQDLRIIVHEASLNGSFGKEGYPLRARGDVLMERFVLGNKTYIQDRGAKLDISLLVNSREGLYTLENAAVTLNELQLRASGWVIDHGDRHEVNLSLSTNNASLAELASAVPEAFRSPLKDYRFKGKGKITLVLKGRFDGIHIPALDAGLQVTEAQIRRSGTSVSLKDLSLKINYSFEQDRVHDRLCISGLKARLNNGSLSGNLLLTEQDSPGIKADLKVNLDLEDLKEWLKADTLNRLKGRFQLEGKFDGRIADIKHPSADDFNQSRFSGNARISGAEIGLKGYNLPATAIEGSFTFDNNNLDIGKLAFRLGKSDFTLQGIAGNLLGWLLVKNEKLTIRSTHIFSGRTNWDEISESSPGSGQYNFKIPRDVEIAGLQLNLKNFSFRKFSAGSLSAELQMQNRQFTASKIRVQSMQGVLSGQASLNASGPDHSYLQCKVRLEKVNLKSLFASFGNFGGTSLTSGKLDGQLTADVIFAAMMYPNLEMDAPSVKAHADIRVENGRLVKYAPMQGLSKFLRVEDLADIRFATLENQVDIANQMIYVPGMEIKSSVVDLNLMGTHTFGNELDYHFSIALSDLLAARFHKKNPGYNSQSDFGPVEEDKRKPLMIYVSMKGTADDPVFSYDKKAVRDRIAREVKNQKSELKQAFRKEFGPAQGDTLKKAQNAREKAIRKKQEEGKFVIEWEDEKK